MCAYIGTMNHFLLVAIPLSVFRMFDLSHACPDGCHCIKFKSQNEQIRYNITCSRSTIPDDLPSTTFNLVMKRLKLDGFPEEPFHNISNLRSLTIDDSCISKLSNTSFKYLSALHFLKLTNCRLNVLHMEADVFLPLKNIESIDLSFYPELGLKVIGKAFFGIQNSPITELILQYVNNPSAFGRLLNIQFWHYLKNTNVKKIDLKRNRLALIEPGFSRYIPWLEKLILSDNTLVGEEAAFIELFFLQHLEYLDLRNQKTLNKMSNVTNTQSSSLGGSPPHLCISLPKHLKVVLLGSSSVHPASILDFCPNNSLEKLDLSNLGFATRYMGGLTKLKYLDISHNNCGDLSTHFFMNFPSLEVALLGKNSLENYIEHDLNGSIFSRNSRLASLDISLNNIGHLPRGLVRSLANLHILDTSHNHIQSIDEFHVFKQPVMLNFSENDIAQINISTLEIFNKFGKNLTLDLTHNPITKFTPCCNVKIFWEWSQVSTVNLSRKNTFKCLYEGEFVNMSSFAFNKECQSQRNNDGTIILCVSVSFCAITIMSAIGYRNRLTVTWFIIILRRFTRIRADANDHTMEKAYDAFVAYSENDIRWVRKHLIDNLESKRGYRLCIHQRDFTIGYPIDRNISESVQQSKTIILLLTSQFQTSEWCEFEVNMAARQARLETNFIIVPILFNSFHIASSSLMLRTILDENTYIRWSSKINKQLFWESIEKPLGRPLSTDDMQH